MEILPLPAAIELGSHHLSLTLADSLIVIMCCFD